MLAKQLKKFWRPKFQEDAEKYYPVQVFLDYGYTKATCPCCNTLYWRRTSASETCGDSDCLKSYTFIKQDPLDITPEQVFQSFKDHFTTTDIPHTLVNRYPVVARWRDDCEFTAAGIQCYQPFCVTGEVDPPANPLIQAQFCLRFNDLDSIGLSGRHYSGFNMLGIQVFNKKDQRVYWNEDIVRYNIQWLEKLGINLDAVTFTADCWAGGGNLGPCVEYFINGLEVGNMVFMQFKTFPDGTLEELPVQVVDVGIGLERIPWLISGNVTSYITAFPTALQTFTKLISFDTARLNSASWKHFGPRSCLLNVDECEDIAKTWDSIASDSNIEKTQFQSEIEIVRDIYIVLDHLRSLLVAIQDGALPSNVGGGCNLRNVFRRVLSILQKNNWIHIGLDGIYEIMESHRIDLQKIQGPDSFPEFKPMKQVLDIEILRWKTTDADAKSKLQKLLKKNPILKLDDWVVASTTFGIDPDTIAQISAQPIPNDLYSKISEQQELNQVKTHQKQLYDTHDLLPTEQVYYTEENGEEKFIQNDAKLVKIIEDVENKNSKTIFVFDKTIFYPISGGQANDIGIIVTDQNETIEIIDVKKVGPVVFHYAKNTPKIPFISCIMKIDEENRYQLMCHHTGAHVISAACRQILGPHIWQAGAKKTAKEATLDITHFRSLDPEEELEIEKLSNRLVRNSLPITKENLLKNEAENRYGFTLYQGGVVPGSSVRCVCIQNTDFEACCGTHLSNTSRIGLIRLIKSKRVSDGVVRLTFVCGEAALTYSESQQQIINNLKTSWGVDQSQILQTADKFFDGWKKLGNKVDLIQEKLFQERLDSLHGIQIAKFSVFEDTPTRYISQLGEIIGEKFIQNGELITQFMFLGIDFAIFVAKTGDFKTEVESILAKNDVKPKVSPLKGGKGRTAWVIEGAQVIMCVKLSKIQKDEIAKLM
ncbi:Alanyl-tRNA synthetase [Spironucleus salmonicida]|uniref:Alanine--tRNA ligase n=2 Tax=Spironucleus TaxID=39709 RepID=V6LRW9_9EUKA|nr:Alanyl-tRNA synthetase [Spironucleus salmonicida]|eukprot:EST47402.1 Alanyl-tRNA synthetase [Spironucleus salmonicida]